MHRHQVQAVASEHCLLVGSNHLLVLSRITSGPVVVEPEGWLSKWSAQPNVRFAGVRDLAVGHRLICRAVEKDVVERRLKREASAINPVRIQLLLAGELDIFANRVLEPGFAILLALDAIDAVARTSVIPKTLKWVPMCERRIGLRTPYHVTL